MFIGDRGEAPGAEKLDQGFQGAEEVKKLTHADRVEAAGEDFHKLAAQAEVQALEDVAAEKPADDLEAEQFKPLEGSRDNEV